MSLINGTTPPGRQGLFQALGHSDEHSSQALQNFDAVSVCSAQACVC